MTVEAPPEAPAQVPAQEPIARSRRWAWVVVAIGCLVAAAVAVFALTGSDSRQTYAYELNGTLDEAEGGAPAETVGGTVTGEGFVFDRGDGITLDVDLGEEYEVEARLRLDKGADGQYFNFVKLFDLQNRNVEAGLYVYNESSLVYFFSSTCDGVEDAAQGCPSSGKRQALIGPPNGFPMQTFTTVRLVRSGDEVEVYVDDELQSWLVFPGVSATAERLDRFTDFGGETIQRGRVIIDPETRERQVGPPVLHVLLDDFATGGVETGTGELDYVRIATW